MTGEEKRARYEELRKEVAAVVAGETSCTARFATASCLLSEAFKPRYFWTGFYEVDPRKPNELVVGPYQGTMGCLRIPFGRGVCGAAAASLKTQLVADVHAFADHIACDARTNSEIVVPVLDANGALVAVLDVDSEQYDAFDEIDREGLEAICRDILTV
jgi:GAF domain-containing protein